MTEMIGLVDKDVKYAQYAQNFKGKIKSDKNINR